MNEFIIVYLYIGFAVATYYIYYAFKYESNLPQYSAIKFAIWYKKLLVYILMYLMCVAFWPIALIELAYKYKNRKEGKL